jgi:chaperonin GroES
LSDRYCQLCQYTAGNSAKTVIIYIKTGIGTKADVGALSNFKLNSKYMSVKIQPIADRVLVEAAPAEEKTAGGIIIPDTAKEKPQRGKVVAVGAGKKDEPMTVKAGQTVLYGKYSGTEINIDGNDYLIMRESDILAIID